MFCVRASFMPKGAAMIERTQCGGCTSGIMGYMIPPNWYRCYYCQKAFCERCAESHFQPESSAIERLLLCNDADLADALALNPQLCTRLAAAMERYGNLPQ